MPTIKFIKEKKEIEVPVGTNLRSAALESGVNLYQGINGFGAAINKVINCHGFGGCGTCVVKITKGMENTNSMGLLEKARFVVPIPDPGIITAGMQYISNPDTIRLACKTKVNGDIEVETGPELNLFGENFFS